MRMALDGLAFASGYLLVKCLFWLDRLFRRWLGL